MSDETTPGAGGESDAPLIPSDPVNAETQQSPQQDQRTAPETYQWTMPEGVTIAPEALDAFGGVAKDLGLPQDQAQSIVDRVAPAIAAAQQAAHEAKVKGWFGEAVGDKEIGGDKFDESLAKAKVGLNSFASPELMTALNDSGLWAHPAMIKYLIKVGQAIGPDTIPARGAGPGNDGRSVAQRLFSSMPNP